MEEPTVVRWMPVLGAAGLLLAGAPEAHAWETDQLTDRPEPLRDVAPEADAFMDRLLGQAVERTNKRTRCRKDPDRTKLVLARQIYRVAGKNVFVKGRGFFKGLGYGEYGRFMETSPDVDRRYFADRRDIYGELTFWDSVILNLAGACSTFNVGGVLLGSDKLDHFVDEGFAYYKHSRWGRYPERGVEYGTRRENHLFGLLTSRAFSFGDLKANHDGYLFYDRLFEPGSVLQLGEDGCVEQERGWSWTEWVDWRYDEVLDPSVYAPRVQRRLDEYLPDRADRLCADLKVWAPEGLEAVRAAHPYEGPEVDWIGEEAPERFDPFHLERLCDPASK